MTVDIIQFIPRPKRDNIQTDFPTITFRSDRQNPVSDPVDASLAKRTAPAIREA